MSRTNCERVRRGLDGLNAGLGSGKRLDVVRSSGSSTLRSSVLASDLSPLLCRAIMAAGWAAGWRGDWRPRLPRLS